MAYQSHYNQHFDKPFKRELLARRSKLQTLKPLLACMLQLATRQMLISQKGHTLTQQCRTQLKLPEELQERQQ